MIVTALHRHPVESLLGETVTRARIDARGLDGDRRHRGSEVSGSGGAGGVRPSGSWP
ncbi:MULTISPECIES: hypothetical protein [Kitasatospora]|uniref:MOSC domain-containing protein n=1 Tax=Kitasatospora setae (strain ATCC 33774 / DSM 43861 / JCM 3304 / KCC A-0304 / NBRC 14216 / KM-6054) TaxID=452652 RepID=E4N061_KITSK|nr:MULTISPECIES: hypothetical protein [Kitasatospora]BAJ31389.1 hypothetical protein KSE_56160 [Kitasatospora setae KM-6054]